jgi:hypothetical protein
MAMSIGNPFNRTRSVMRSWCSFISMTIAFQVFISSGVPILIYFPSPLLVWFRYAGAGLIASREAHLYYGRFVFELELPEWALRLLAPPQDNPVSLDRTAPKTIKAAWHLNSPPHKKPLNLFSLSYSRVEREKRLTMRSLPLRAAKTNAALERRDRLLRANL